MKNKPGWAKFSVLGWAYTTSWCIHVTEIKDEDITHNLLIGSDSNNVGAIA